MKKWELKQGKDIIIIENRFLSERLYVNGELQDEQMGSLFGSSRLWGKLPNGDELKVSLGGFWAIHCRVFINNKLMLSE